MLRNPTFDMPGIMPGDAMGWRIETVSTQVAWAEFGASSLDSVTDRFEAGWANDVPISNDDFELAIFDQAGEPALVDDFERGWMGNEAGIDDIGAMPIQDATFDQAGMPGPRDDFERGWGGNEGAIPDLPSMPASDAAFGDTPAPQAREQFDQQWAGCPGSMEPKVLFDFLQQVDFIKDTPDEISIDLPGDFVVSGIRAGSPFSISGAAKAQNNGAFTAITVSPILITLSTNEQLQNDDNELVRFQNLGTSTFDGQDAETMEFTWTAMDEDL